MATYYARKSGNVNDVDVWATTPAGTADDYFPSFTSSDVLIANSFTIDLNVDTTVAEIAADTTGGATAGGHFRCNTSGVTLTSNLKSAASTTTQLLLLSSSNITFTLEGNILAYSGTVRNAFRITGSNANVTINGNVNSSTTATKEAIHFDSTDGSLTINGNINGTTANVVSVMGVYVLNAATLIIIGNINGSSNSGTSNTGYSLWVVSNGTTINITGDITGPTAAAAARTFLNAGNNTITITGNLSNGGNNIISVNHIAFENTGNSNIIINGNLSTIGVNGYVANISGTGSLTINGDLSTNTWRYVLSFSSTGLLTINGDITNSNSAAGPMGAVIKTNNGDVIVDGNITTIGTQSTAYGINKTSGNGNITVYGNILSTNTSPGINWITAGTGNITIEGDVSAGTSGNGITKTTAGNITITGSVTGGTGTNGKGVEFSGSSGTVIIDGDITGGSGSSSFGFHMFGTTVTPRIVEITGNILGGSGTTARGVTIEGSSTVNLTIEGNITGGDAANGLNYTTSGISTITGNITGGTSTGGGVSHNAGNLTINGNIFGGTAGTTTYGFFHAGTGLATININGNVTGGSGSSSIGLYNNGNATINVYGDVTGGTGGLAAHGAYIFSTGVLNLIYGKVIGGPTISSGAGVMNGNGVGAVYVKTLEFGETGMSPVRGSIRFIEDPINAITVHRYLNSPKTLVDPVAVVSADPADVREGTLYDNDTQTGTLKVPPATAVLNGIPVDDTTGTLVMTTSDFWGAQIDSLDIAGSIGERLKNAATIASVGQQLSDALSDL